MLGSIYFLSRNLSEILLLNTKIDQIKNIELCCLQFTRKIWISKEIRSSLDIRCACKQAQSNLRSISSVHDSVLIKSVSIRRAGGNVCVCAFLRG